MNALERFEKLVERLVESPFERLFKGGLHPADVANVLAEAVEKGQLDDGRGGRLVPNHYQVFLNQADYRAMQARAALAEEVAAIERYLTSLQAETGGQTVGPVAVHILPGANIGLGQIKVRADYLARGSSTEPKGASPDETRPLKNPGTSAPAAQWQLCWAEKAINLGRPVINLGRAPDNDVVIADRTVSRYHAQLRWRKQTYYVQNLSRTQPLKVNGQPVRGSLALKPGDYLELGQVSIRIDLAL